MKGNPMKRNFGIAVSPMKVDPPKYTYSVPNPTSSSTAGKFDPNDMRVKIFKDKDFDAAKRSARQRAFAPKDKIAKTATKTVGKRAVRKKAAKSLVGKILGRAIPGVGYAMAAHDIIKIGGKMLKGKSFKQAAGEHYLGTKTKPKSKNTTPRPTKKKYRIKTN